MPQFDESFLSDCALAEQQRPSAYWLNRSSAGSYGLAAASSGSGSGGGGGGAKVGLYQRRRRNHLRAAKLFVAYALTPSPPQPPSVVIKQFVRYSTVTSPSTPPPHHHHHSNHHHPSSLSSQTNLHNLALNSPSPSNSSNATPPSASPATPATPGTPGSGCVPPPAPPPHGSGSGLPGSSGHKNSLKGTKLARRARSFKDDLFERISLMRTPNSNNTSGAGGTGGGGGSASGVVGNHNNNNSNTLGRAHSPAAAPSNERIQMTTPHMTGAYFGTGGRHKGGMKAPPTAAEVARSTHSLDQHVKDISNALKHFRDVILKKKLEVLPGNGTVILETIASMYSVIQSYTLNEHSALLASATQQVYQSLGKLIRFCDEVMLSEEDVSEDNVKEVVDLLEDAVKNLASLAQQKLKEKQENPAYTHGSTGGGAGGPISSHHLMRPPIEVAGQRTSLPDITLTPKERDILEKTNSNPIRASHSTESILRDTSPPPKPPLPTNRPQHPPPPLPPKRRQQQQQQQQQGQSGPGAQQQAGVLQHGHSGGTFSNNISLNSDLDCSSDLSLIYAADRLSVRSRSPDENSSQCSQDSALNHSREEEEAEDEVQKFFGVAHSSAIEGGTTTGGGGGITMPTNTMTTTTTLTGGAGETGAGGPTSAAAGFGGCSALAARTTTALGAHLAAGVQSVAAATVLAAGSGASAGGCLEMRKTSCDNTAAAAGGSSSCAGGGNNRHSNESGFVSMQSFRTSTQSVSKRSSDNSYQSSSSSSTTATTKSSSSEMGSAFETIENVTASDFQFQQNQTQQQQQRHHQQTAIVSLLGAAAGSALTTMTTTTSSTSSSSSNTTSKVFNTTTIATGSSSSNSTATLITTSGSATSSSSISSATTIATTTAGTGMAGVGVGVAPIAYIEDNHSLSTASSTSLEFNGQSQCATAIGLSNESEPPALPPKSLGGRQAALQLDSNFDEIDEVNSFGEFPELRHPHHAYVGHHQEHQQYHHVYQCQTKHQSLIEPRSAGVGGLMYAGSMDGRLDEAPPPLPMKKKYILAYMEICSSTTPRSNEQHRHTMHAFNPNQRNNITHSQTMNIAPLTKELPSPEHDIPPALPPKTCKKRPTRPPTIITTPPPSPKPSLDEDAAGAAAGRRISAHARILSSQGGDIPMTTVCEELNDFAAADADDGEDSDDVLRLSNDSELIGDENVIGGSSGMGGAKPGDRGSGGGDSGVVNTPGITYRNRGENICLSDINNEEDEGIDVVSENHNNYNSKKRAIGGVGNNSNNNNSSLPNMLEEIDIAPFLIFKKDNEDGPEVKGGYIDALIVHASRVQKDTAFSEAFITTFRTFIQPIDVIEKLTHRYTIFFCQVNEDVKQKAAKETFSLLVRVVNDLTATDLTSSLFKLLAQFVHQLVCSGELYLAKLLRNKYVEKAQLYKDQRGPIFPPDNNLITHQPSLLDLKSVEIAEQMTLLDAELFQKIEIPEVLLFAKDQCEEKSPNLNKFTEHFNKMSYWARSKILMLEDAKERERHVMKFIKIMKHLRKMNNYNSYLALLSALDSAPIRRLEWHKTITEGLKEYCTLIDSSSSFRVYRQALAETNPPCIPYIGLVLQDLTFVHVGNPDYLKKDVINFSKRWQQHNIIVNMKRFKKCSYPFRRSERIICFFENFDKHLGEEEMWQISEHIKPRAKRPTHN